MARPTKTGMDYFPLDIHLSDEVFAVECAHGNDGYAVIIKTWQALYQTDTGSIDCSDVIRRITLAKRANISVELWEAIITTCAAVGLFDKDAWQNQRIITSHGVLKRIKRVNEEREAARHRMKKRYDSSYSPNNPTNNSDNSPNNPTNNATKGKEREKEREREREILLREREVLLGEGEILLCAPEEELEPPLRAESRRFAEWYAKELKPPNLKDTPSTREQWALVWYHLRHTDKRENVKEMAGAIQWARGDPFWSRNFLSPNKLRDRDKNGLPFIDRIIADFQNSKKTQTNGHKRGITPLDFQEFLGWINDNPAIPA